MQENNELQMNTEETRLTLKSSRRIQRRSAISHDIVSVVVSAVAVIAIVFTFCDPRARRLRRVDEPDAQ